MTHVSLDGMVGIAAGNGFQAPGPADFEFPDIFNGNQVLLAKSSLLLVLGVAQQYRAARPNASN